MLLDLDHLHAGVPHDGIAVVGEVAEVEYALDSWSELERGLGPLSGVDAKDKGGLRVGGTRLGARFELVAA